MAMNLKGITKEAAKKSDLFFIRWINRKWH
jgi:hypothetical protein